MYAKLFSSILDSSLWTADPPTRILFLTMLAMADREGRIFASRSGLCRRACIPPEDFDRALAVLQGPDEESSDLTRNPSNGGRRIELADGGWQVLNYVYYRDLRDEDERRHDTRERVRRFRQRKRSETLGNDPKRSVSQSNPSESESSSESESPKRKIQTQGRVFVRPSFDEVKTFIEEKGLPVDPTAWYSYYESNGWKVGKNPMKKWKPAVWTWVAKENSSGSR